MAKSIELIKSLRGEIEYSYEKVLQEESKSGATYYEGILHGIELCLSTLQGAEDRESSGEN